MTRTLQLLGQSFAWVIAAAALIVCEPDPRSAGTPGAGFEVRVTPLSLTGIIDARYRVFLHNAQGDLVWDKTITSVAYGDGRGSASVVGPCDATSSPNRVFLVIEELQDLDGALPPGSWRNPAPATNPIFRDVQCDPNADRLVEFNLTIARSAKQGFFDIAVDFDDVFCSAKFDCRYGEDPIHLLHDPDTSERGPTMVLGFACTSGVDQATRLWFELVRVACDNGESYVIDPSRGPGVMGAYPPLFFETAAFRGDEQLPDVDKCYWNLAFGVNVEHLSQIAGGCLLEAHGTASAAPWSDAHTPPDTIWPLLTWRIPLSASNGELTCDPNQNPLDGADSRVRTEYTAPAGHAFDFSMTCGDEGEVSTYGTACDGQIPGAGSVMIRNTSAGISVQVGPIVSPTYALPAELNGAEVRGLGVDCCVDPCCSE